ncbi:sugar transferase [Zhihengliuella sp.]|uniref:sugar transferase n=1 Tax=Zhihengliuella sp. TaxID=1954483 RepID=UPI002811D155|nr:sugar transferase [Zhihengliuella sp.]
MDVVISSAVLVLASIPMAILSVVIRVKIGSPIIFKQLRPGKDATLFYMYKFRTMTDERDANGEMLPDKYRMTPFGTWLRSTSLDELPELVNVLKGDMSLVGPRPLLERYMPFYTRDEMIRFHVRPGITGKAQLNGRNTATWEQRLSDDIEYVETLSLAGDVAILAKTVLGVLQRRGFEVDPQRLMADLDVERQERVERAD